jgi:hypothetical protein
MSRFRLVSGRCRRGDHKGCAVALRGGPPGRKCRCYHHRRRPAPPPRRPRFRAFAGISARRQKRASERRERERIRREATKKRREEGK